MATGRYLAVATALSNGKAMIFGGVAGGPMWATTEIFDPASGTWSAGGDMSAVCAWAAGTTCRTVAS